MLSQDPSSITKPSFYANKRNLSDFNYDNGRSTNGGDDGCIQKTLAPPSSSLSNNNNAANDNVGMRKRINLTNSTNDNVLFASTNNDGYKQETHFESNERHHFPHHPSIVDEIIVAKVCFCIEMIVGLPTYERLCTLTLYTDGYISIT